LSKKSDAVILSMACIHFGSDKELDPDELRESAFFVKLNVEDQVKRLRRSIGKSTLEWWGKQCLKVKDKSFFPKDNDIRLEDGLEKMRIWSNQFKDNKSWVLARGNLDQLVLDDAEEQLGIKPVFHFSRWRDVRTLIDIYYETGNSYCNVEYKDFDPKLHITKHDPVDDCIYDIMMLMYGKKN